MTGDLWHEPGIKSFGLRLNGTVMSHSNQMPGCCIFIWFNANPFRVEARMPAGGAEGCWRCAISSVDEDLDPVAGLVPAASTISLPSISSHLFVYEELN